MPEQKKWKSFLLTLVKYLCVPAQVWETTWDSTLERASVKCVYFAAPWGKARVTPFWGTDAIPRWKQNSIQGGPLNIRSGRAKEDSHDQICQPGNFTVTLLYLIFFSDFDCSPPWTCSDSSPCWLCEYKWTISTWMDALSMFPTSQDLLFLWPPLWRKQTEIFLWQMKLWHSLWGRTYSSLAKILIKILGDHWLVWKPKTVSFQSDLSKNWKPASHPWSKDQGPHHQWPIRLWWCLPESSTSNVAVIFLKLWRHHCLHSKTKHLLSLGFSVSANR